mgnify:CR=1 FL=1
MPKHSPSYPHVPLEKALERARKIFEEDRTNVIDRETAAKHVGYSSISGASDKMLATLANYGLLEPSGKGQVRLTALALDIFAPENESSKKKALYLAGTSPSLFALIDESFEVTPSMGALKNWMIRRDFVDSAITPASKSYFRTMEYLERQEAIESGGPSSGESAKLDEPDDSNVVYGGATVGTLVQWEQDGALQLSAPTRVRQVTPDGEWVFVDGSETGIPMSQTIVEKTATAPPAPVIAPPTLALAMPPTNDALPKGSFVLSSGKVKDVSFEVRVTGEVNQTVIDRIIKYLDLAKDDYDE